MVNFVFLFVSVALTAPAFARVDERAALPQDPASLFSSFVPPKHVPEIMDLKPDDTIPPSVYEKYPAMQVALTIVYKKYVEDEANGSKKVKHPKCDHFHGSEIQLAFDEKIIASIAQRGFLNTYQVGDRMDAYVKGRAEIEDKFLGYHLDASFPPGLSALVHPKSAYFSLQAVSLEENPLNENRSDPSSHGLQLGYGSIFAVFNDDVKNRSTFTMEDSTGIQSKGDVKTLKFKSEACLRMAPNADYMEAQIWGPVTIRDVNHFIVNCDEGLSPLTNQPQGTISAAGLKELEKLNLPIFECTEEKVGGRLIRIKEGKQLFFPSQKQATEQQRPQNNPLQSPVKSSLPNNPCFK